MMHRAWSSIVEVPYSFSRSYVKFQGHTALKTRWIWPKLGVSGQQLHFEFTDGYEMLHKAWNSKGEVPYCFPRSSIKFQGHTGQNITDFDPNWAFPDNRPVAAFKSLRFALFYFILFILFFFWGGGGWWMDNDVIVIHAHHMYVDIDMLSKNICRPSYFITPHLNFCVPNSMNTDYTYGPSHAIKNHT